MRPKRSLAGKGARMKKQQSAFLKLLNFITYKKTSRPPTFVLHKTNEERGFPSSGDSQDKGESGQDSTVLPAMQKWGTRRMPDKGRFLPK